jgi:hypothetical protein
LRARAYPLDGKIVCREITAEDEATENVTPLRSPQSDRQSGTGRGKR